jgi:hypothetical protein
MIFELVELIEFSGPKTTIYSLYLEDENQTLFDKFLADNIEKHRQEILSILDKLNKMSQKFGAERMFFKENEGKLGDLVCALYDSPDSNLRLYCIRLGKTIIILGGGGYKSKLIRALQEDPTLTKENLLMRKFSEILGRKMKDRDIIWKDEMTLDGNFIIDTDE